MSAVLIFTRDSSVNIWQWGSGSLERAILMMSLHFLGVSSTLPARNKQHAAVTWEQRDEKDSLYDLNTYITVEILKGMEHRIGGNRRPL
jgi:hypothetical protein